MSASQQIFVQKCVDSQQIHLNRKCRKKESVDLTTVHLGIRVDGGTALVRTGCRKFSIAVPDYGVFGMGSSSPSLVSAHVASAHELFDHVFARQLSPLLHGRSRVQCSEYSTSSTVSTVQ
jgi:hypothetical protein